ncbi:CPBP family intramembrane metalloprotease [Streptomyces sp. PKU-EA00015]|uniref:CPBP family intramembrane glutamic endopeptidase n=1 Tax=Streptomyces sp. PKU-EA00015 TaxID=2748326 RepID=UPI0015A1E825|nr:CPBP family intramembrane glutamic endopeptidase [Streptomyces sp. PKU-EA00015]NWF30566.1 CPBP family intramembrane metalloprotease [Streptomyces sp. PKU-EA00015]
MTTDRTTYVVGPPPPGHPPAVPLPYHRLARVTHRHRWWRPLLGTLVVIGGTTISMLVLLLFVEFAAMATDRPVDAEGWRTWGDIGDAAILLLSIAVAIPPVLLAARWTQRRPAGTVSSVAGHLRWRWLGTCLVAGLPLVVAALGVSLLLPDPTGDSEDVAWAGLSSFLLGLGMVCVLVPFQAAAEEYVCRGWLLQAVGAWCRSPWIAIAPQSVLFAAAHGWGTPWGFADLVVFGLVTGLLTIRTGGLEAAIALHVLNNLLAMGIAAAIAGALASDETAADMEPLAFAVDVVMLVLYAAVVLWLARRRRLSALTSPAADPRPTP